MTWETLVSDGRSLVGCQIKVAGTWYLIGDVNALAGVCDDCPAFSHTDEIEEIVWPNATGVIQLVGEE